MHCSYDDLYELTDKSPVWFDENAVPRWCEFHPSRIADIYADEACLFEVTCQGCGRKFLVAGSRGKLFYGYDQMPGATLAGFIKNRDLHYGDPPNVGCCVSGPTMNSEPRRVIEYWSRNDKKFTKEDPDHPGLSIVTDIEKYIEWVRDPSLEVDITPDWVTE